MVDGVPRVSRHKLLKEQAAIGTRIEDEFLRQLSLRSFNGRGGFATPGLNLAAAFHARTKNGDLYLNFGSPSADATLNRMILKYVFRIGADAGT